MMMRHLTNGKGLRRGLIVIALVLFAAWGASIISPKPADASCGCACNPGVCPGDVVVDPASNAEQVAEDAATTGKLASGVAWLGKIAGELSTLYNTFIKGFTELFTTGERTTAAKNTSRQLQTEISNKLTDAKINSDLEAKKAAEQLRDTYEKPKASPADQYMCNQILLNMAMPIMQQFADMVTEFLVRGMMSAYRGPGEQGDGPQHSLDHLIMICREGLGSNVDGFPKNCRPMHEVPGVSTAGMNEDADVVMSRQRYYTLPKGEKKTFQVGNLTTQATVLSPDTTDETQNRFIKAVQYCYTVAGGNASPPFGSLKITGKGLIEEGRVSECQAIQSDFIYACAAMIGRRTRPDCTQKDMEPICNYAVQGCSAGKTFQIGLGPEYDDCTHGLSLQQFETLSHKMCGAPSDLQSRNNLGGGEGGKNAQAVTACGAFHDMWQSQLNLLELNLKKAYQGLVSNRSCFAQVRK